MEKAVALRNEARSYEHGEGVKREPAKAVQLYCESARLGDVEAQYSLGWMYAKAAASRAMMRWPPTFSTWRQKKGTSRHSAC